MNTAFAIGIILATGMFGMYLDVVRGYKEPPAYFLIGLLGGTAAMMVGRY